MTGLRVLNLPQDHDFVRQALPPESVFAAPMTGRQAKGWDVSPAFDPRWVDGQRDRFDLVHLHFGFERLSPSEVTAWADHLRLWRIPVVFTVHDLRNPHHPTAAAYDALLRIVTAAAAEVVTLTPGAAAEVRERFGRRATVIAHPPLIAETTPRGRSGTVGVSLKARAQVVEPDAVVMAVLRGVESARPRRADTSLLVSADPGVRAGMPGSEAAAAAGRLTMTDLEPLPPRAFAEALAGLEVAVLPYRFGTHSGWLEACRDVGTRVVAPDCGYYAEQWDEAETYGNNESTGLDPGSLMSATRRALLAAPLASSAPQQARIDASRSGYAEVYDRALGLAS